MGAISCTKLLMKKAVKWQLGLANQWNSVGVCIVIIVGTTKAGAPSNSCYYAVDCSITCVITN